MREEGGKPSRTVTSKLSRKWLQPEPPTSLPGPWDVMCTSEVPQPKLGGCGLTRPASGRGLSGRRVEVGDGGGGKLPGLPAVCRGGGSISGGRGQSPKEKLGFVISLWKP